MFTNFRSKLNSVIQDGITLSESLAAQYSKPFNPGQYSDQDTSGERLGSAPKAINLNAGHQILENNEQTWESIRILDEKNATLARDIDGRIMDIMNESIKALTTISDINSSLAALPNIVSELKICTETIEEIGDKIQVCESKLMELEDLNEVLNLQERQLDERFEMAMYKEKKLASLDKFREELGRSHSEKVVQQEKHMKQMQAERQIVFQNEFQKDIEYYKKTGNIPKITPKSNEKETVLEEIVLDDENSKDLNDFLEK